MADAAPRRRWLRGAAGLLAAASAGAGARGAGAQSAGARGAGVQGTDVQGPGVQGPGPRRLVALGGTITEIVFALDAGGRLVGVDDSSLYPPAAQRLPKVGYYRSFSVEGVAGLAPDLVLASNQAGPPGALDRLRGLGLRVALFDAAPTLAALEARITGIAETIGEAAAGARLRERVRSEIAAARPLDPPPRVLVLSSHTGRMLSAGRETAADAMLTLVGARNAIESQNGYKPISGESVAALRPESIVTTTMSIGASGGLAAFRSQPGIAATPAARNGRIVVIDDLLLLGFGPRIGEALRELSAGLAPHVARSAVPAARRSGT
ncbi:MAG: hemin ABC transporter substrate-binding protein [Lautropia sp.]